MKKSIIYSFLFALMAALIFFGCLNSGSVQEERIGPVPDFVINPAAPYDSPHGGLHHGQHGGNMGQHTDARYSVYVPPHAQPWSPLVLVLIPNNTTAKTFAESQSGKEWLSLADQYEFIVVFYEPKDGKTWNIAADAAGRDEALFFDHLFAALASKVVRDGSSLGAPQVANTNAVFTRDKTHMSMVGYGEGGAMALQMASIWPSLFSAVATVNATEANQEYITSSGNELSYPFVTDSKQGQAEMALPNKDIPVPLWIVSQSQEVNTFAQSYYITANSAVTAANNQYTTARYTVSGSPARVWVTRGESAANITSLILYTEFLSLNSRLLGWPGGILRDTVFFRNHPDAAPGYTEINMTVDGFVRRWVVYQPASYNPGRETPLVLALHGFTGSGYGFAEESLWAEVADNYGFIVIFPQAYPNVSNSFNNPVPAWNSRGVFPNMPMATSTNDVLFLQEVINWAKGEYNIDNTRVYGTGHSNGASMLWYAALQDPGMFAAIAPVGWMQRGADEDIANAAVQIPIWTFKGEFDTNTDAASLAPDSANTLGIEFWRAFNKMDTTRTGSVRRDGDFITTTYDFNGQPLVSFTEVKNSPHAYLNEQSWMIWEDFFVNYRRALNGTVLYN